MLDLIASAPRRRGFSFVGIGGRGGSGKSTLAARIPGAQVVGTDEFWNGESFALSRLRAEVFDPLLLEREARYALRELSSSSSAASSSATFAGLVK